MVRESGVDRANPASNPCWRVESFPSVIPSRYPAWSQCWYRRSVLSKADGSGQISAYVSQPDVGISACTTYTNKAENTYIVILRSQPLPVFID